MRPLVCKCMADRNVVEIKQNEYRIGVTVLSGWHGHSGLKALFQCSMRMGLTRNIHRKMTLSLLHHTVSATIKVNGKSPPKQTP